MSNATIMRDRYLAAELAILEGQSIDFGGRRLTMADLDEVRKGRAEWERRCNAEARGGNGMALANFSGTPSGGEGRERHGWSRDR